MSVDLLGTSWDHCRSMVHCRSFTSTETRRLVTEDGQPRTATSTLTQLLNYDSGRLSCFTSTEAAGLLGTGRPPRLSHSSWTICIPHVAARPVALQPRSLRRVREGSWVARALWKYAPPVGSMRIKRPLVCRAERLRLVAGQSGPCGCRNHVCVWQEFSLFP